MNTKDIIIIFLALIVAYFMMNVFWVFARFLIQIIFIVVIAYFIYNFLKKIL